MPDRAPSWAHFLALLIAGVGPALHAPSAAAEVGHPSTMEPPHDLSGEYDGTWGATTLEQDGLHVSGTYAYHHGQIDGTRDGATVRFAWIEDDGSGRGTFAVRDDGVLIGTWGMGYDDHGGGAWSLARAGTRAPDPAAAPPGAGAWQVGIRITWDVQSLPDGVVIGVGGAGLAVGARVTDRVYVGASFESESVTQVTGTEGTAGSYDTLRAGGEARYYFHDGVAWSTPDEQQWGPVARHDWIGLRYGVETFDHGATIGRYADATLGTDIDLGMVGLGLYLTAGVSRQASSAFDQPAPAPIAVTFTTASSPLDTREDPMTTSPYVGFGMSLLFE